MKSCILRSLVCLVAVLGTRSLVSADEVTGGFTLDDAVFHFINPDNCSDGNFCNGIERKLSNGSCLASAYPVCDDRNPDTIDTCSEATRTCTHTPKADTSICLETCSRVCTNKECGEDGCGGFCGSCPQGKGCQCSSQNADGNCIASQCVNASADGTCLSPVVFGPGVINVPAGGQLKLSIEGDTSHAFHAVSPQCNVASAAPELFYTFTIPQGRTYGVEMRATGYDTVLQLSSGCQSGSLITCSDDATPPGDLGSKVSALLPAGTYYVMMDGYSALDNGPFVINARFVDNCVPLCDGNYCGDDECGSKCGTCDTGKVCRNLVCYPGACEPQCDAAGRTCGDDGCGGSCGTCTGASEKCIGEGFELDEDGNPPRSYCVAFPTCNHTQPVCTGCTSSQYCGHDCKCYNLDEQLPDLVLDKGFLESNLFYETVTFVNSSCSVRGGCVTGHGPRKLLRFTTAILNQGADWAPIGSSLASARPDLYAWSSCRAQYEMLAFSAAYLHTADRSRVELSRVNSVVCLEDSERAANGSSVGCRGTYTCESPGISQGWVDFFGWSLDCSWLDVTEVPPGNYFLELVLNPNQVFQELTYDNNVGGVPVHIPCHFPTGPVAAIRVGGTTCTSAATGMMAMLASAWVAFLLAAGVLLPFLF